MKQKQPHTLSFEVTSICETQKKGVTVFRTDLRCYWAKYESVSIRGKYWPVGTKLDFKLMKVEEPER